MVASLLTTNTLHQLTTNNERPTLPPGNWFANDTRIEEILRENVKTNFTYLVISKPYYTPSYKGEPGVQIQIVPFFADYDVWYRYFEFYPFDPETTPDNENYRLEGVIFVDGLIRLYGLIPADVRYY